jgi:hypothetical protein
MKQEEEMRQAVAAEAASVPAVDGLRIGACVRACFSFGVRWALKSCGGRALYSYCRTGSHTQMQAAQLVQQHSTRSADSPLQIAGRDTGITFPVWWDDALLEVVFEMLKRHAVAKNLVVVVFNLAGSKTLAGENLGALASALAPTGRLRLVQAGTMSDVRTVSHYQWSLHSKPQSKSACTHMLYFVVQSHNSGID